MPRNTVRPKKNGSPEIEPIEGGAAVEVPPRSSKAALFELNRVSAFASRS